MPRTAKPAGTAVDKRNGRRADLVVVPGTRLDAPEGMSDETLAYWDAYWDDPVSSIVTPADTPMIIRWARELDRYNRLVAEGDKNPVVRGSQGQPVENPCYGIAYKALAAVQLCERNLGIGPLWRSNLGIAIVSEKRSLADMNAKYGGADGRPRPVEAADPRVIDA